MKCVLVTEVCYSFMHCLDCMNYRIWLAQSYFFVVVFASVLLSPPRIFNFLVKAKLDLHIYEDPGT